MRKLFVASLFLIATAAAPSLAADQSAGKIIDRYRKAAGGNALARIKSTILGGSLKSSDGSTGRFTFQTTAPDKLRIDIEIGGSKTSECYNGKSAWRMDQRGLRTLLGDEAKRLRLETLLVNGGLRELQRSRIVPQPPQKADVDGREAAVIEFLKDNVRVKLFFDSKTGLITKQERETTDGVEEVFFSDHRAVDGLMEPHAIRIKRGALDLVIAIDRVQHDANVDLAVFRYPQVDGAPLPDLETVMKAIIANQEKVDELREHYTCRMTEIERKHDGDGRVKETETKIYEVTPIGDEAVERLLSVNGKELSPSEQEKEDKRIQKEIEEILKRREKKQQKKEEREAREARGEKEKQDKDELTILDFLRISEITSVRREVFRGQQVIAFDFEPRKGFKPKNRVQDIVNKLAGTIWVDENAKQVARLEARLTDSFKLGGGVLASIAPSTAFAFEQEKIGDEIWMPSFGEANISARVMLFAKFNRSLERRYSDYKKYQIDSKYELNKPKDKQE
jgi:hypothetical protein